jgi:hypothetical protein
MSDVTTPSVPDSSGSIVFIESRLPALLAGEYTVTVEHTLQNTDPAAQSPGDQAHIDKTFATTRRFAVQGPRFSLDPSAIHSVFPPDRSRGEFTDVLAHVVLTNPGHRGWRCWRSTRATASATREAPVSAISSAAISPPIPNRPGRGRARCRRPPCPIRT